jgi:hypothetical protein
MQASREGNRAKCSTCTCHSTSRARYALPAGAAKHASSPELQSALQAIVSYGHSSVPTSSSQLATGADGPQRSGWKPRLEGNHHGRLWDVSRSAEKRRALPASLGPRLSCSVKENPPTRTKRRSSSHLRALTQSHVSDTATEHLMGQISQQQRIYSSRAWALARTMRGLRAVGRRFGYLSSIEDPITPSVEMWSSVLRRREACGNAVSVPMRSKMRLPVDRDLSVSFGVRV